MIGDQIEIFDSRGKARVQTVNDEPSKTVQSEADSADINLILRQYPEMGLLERLNQAEGLFLDVSEFTDYADAIRHTREAEAEFMKLPSKVRELFNHDVAEFLDAAHDDDKRQALIDAGVIDGEAGSAEVGAGDVEDSVDPVVTEGDSPP